MSLNIEYRVVATALNIRAVAMSVHTFFSNIAELSKFASNLELAIAEGMNNIWEHAYGGSNEGFMRVEVTFEHHKNLTISIYDRGEKPDLDRVSSIPELPQQSYDEAEAYTPNGLACEGRGLYIMESLMDSIDYLQIRDENCLRMKKSFQ